ncbi:MAG: 4Fe-4S dicluster domain-containing protein [Desulfobacteraceae bacterium]|jgi:2-oxoglutarate ferredoxin oxidoreductase subunit delta|uniref:4Fe-4S ferredoxin-type domain-containing protein n=1 Tax=marine sediment metagenome TaxID=412755 RepID=X0URS0_9ZZZZ|nr:4Fe-4S binding protein [Pseudomonadota bacterium]RLB29416.1 MAG: 4Fe-4S ferredoxin [Deltaproteobacteria bacterium]TET94787.1 MAG: 4Fe-4S dicluster domain-containing protein [Desulfobacteraceae bacterium]
MATKLKRGFIKIEAELCKGCYLCTSVCPLNLISVSDSLNQKGYYPAQYNEKGIEIENHLCKGCALCAIICPDIAIEVYRG